MLAQFNHCFTYLSCFSFFIFLQCLFSLCNRSEFCNNLFRLRLQRYLINLSSNISVQECLCWSVDTITPGSDRHSHQEILCQEVQPCMSLASWNTPNYLQQAIIISTSRRKVNKSRVLGVKQNPQFCIPIFFCFNLAKPFVDGL